MTDKETIKVSGVKFGFRFKNLYYNIVKNAKNYLLFFVAYLLFRRSCISWLLTYLLVLVSNE